MSRKTDEFIHRTSIFEAAYRAWSQLGGLEQKELQKHTTANNNLDPVHYVIPNDIRITSQQPQKQQQPLHVRRIYPFERLPVSGLSHPYVQSILNAWLKPTEDKEGGLTTLRTWWYHRRKGQSKSAIRFLDTPEMSQKVDDYTTYFFQIAYDLSAANNNKSNNNDNNNNKNNDNDNNHNNNSSSGVSVGGGGCGGSNEKHVLPQLQKRFAAGAGVDSPKPTLLQWQEIEQSQQQKQNNHNPENHHPATVTTTFTISSKKRRFMDDNNNNNKNNNNVFDPIVGPDDYFDCSDDDVTLVNLCHPVDRKKQKRFHLDGNDEDIIPTTEVRPEQQQQLQQQQQQQVGTAVVLTTKEKNNPQTQGISAFLDASDFGASESSLGDVDWSTFDTLLSTQCHLFGMEKGYCAVAEDDEEKEKIEDSYCCSVFNDCDNTLPHFDNNTNNSSPPFQLNPSQEQQNDTITTANTTHSEIWNNNNMSEEDGNLDVNNNSKTKNTSFLLDSTTTARSTSVEDPPKNDNSSKICENSNNKNNIHQIIITVGGITSIHDVDVIETVLKGCEGNVSPIGGLLDAVVDVSSSQIVLQVDHGTHAKKIALEAIINLALMGYTAHTKQQQ